VAHLLDYLKDRILLCDGAMGTEIQARQLHAERDFWGHENCSEILNESRPDLVREIYRGYYRAGADAIQTNTFGGSPVTLGEFGLQDRAFDLNKCAVELAREVREEFASDGRTRFIIGSVGPGTRLPTLGHIDYQTLEDALAIQRFHGPLEAYLGSRVRGQIVFVGERFDLDSVEPPADRRRRRR
jgi:5-methyltetrahydrofolate--homocysteine methyltransferase